MAAANMSDYAALAVTFNDKVEQGTQREFDPTISLWSFASVAACLLVRLEEASAVLSGQVSESARLVNSHLYRAALEHFESRAGAVVSVQREQVRDAFELNLRSAVEVCTQFVVRPEVDLGELGSAIRASSINVLGPSEADALRMAMVSDMALSVLVWEMPASTYEYAQMSAKEALHAHR